MKILVACFLICMAAAAAFVSDGFGRENTMALRQSTLPTPTPEPNRTPDKTLHSENGVIWSEASAAGVSIPVRDMPVVKPTTTQPPREINPQNRFPIKPVGSAHKPEPPATPSAKKPSKKKSVRVRKVNILG